MPGPDELVVDAAVVGAGIAGASAAWHLSRAGLDVVVLEQEAEAGRHATGRSAAVLSETSGPEVTCRLAALSRPFLSRPPEGFCEHPLVSERGLLWLAGPGREVMLDDLARRGQRLNGTVRRLDAAETVAIVPTLSDGWAAQGSVHEPEAVAVDVASLLAGFLKGQRLLRHAELRHGTRTGGAWHLVAGERRIRAGVVVDAAGAWGDVVATRCGVEPLGLQPLLRTAALVAAPEAVAGWPLVMDVDGRWYAEPEAGGLLVSPADETPTDPCDARPEELAVALGLERASQALGIELRHVRRAWAGLRTFTPDRLPACGPEPDARGFFWLVGQGGSGIKTAPALGELLAAAVTGGDPHPMAPAVDPARLR